MKCYNLKVACRNCDFGNFPHSAFATGEEIEIPIGTKVVEIPCPKCGCKELFKK